MPFRLLSSRSTGRWDITPVMHTISPILSGQLIVEREGDTVWLDFRNLDADSQDSYVLWGNLLPMGMRPPRADATNYIYIPLSPRSSTDTAGPVQVSIYGDLSVYGHTGLIRGLVAFRTTQAMITSVPGGVRV